MPGKFAVHFNQMHDAIADMIGQDAFDAAYPELVNLLDAGASSDDIPAPLAVFEAVIAKIARRPDGLDMHLLNASKRDLHNVPHCVENIYLGNGGANDERLMNFVGNRFDKDFIRANYLSHISGNYRYLYVSAPKSACTKMKKILHEAERHRLLERSAQVHDPAYSPLLEPIDDIATLDTALTSPEWFRFAVVRNPFTRILSCYLDKILRSPERLRLLPILGLPADSTPPPFGEFVRLVSMQDDGQRDLHWASQHYLLRPDVVRYDFLGKVERFPEDLRLICDRLSITLLEPPEKKEHHVGGVESTTGHYDEALRKLVAEVYAKDFAAFGYDPERLP